MKFSDIILTVVIIVIFAALYFYSIMAIGMKKLEKKWPEYRCNPMVMPFASQFGHDAVSNFVFCIGNIQKGMMGFFLKPVMYVVTLAGSMGTILTDAVQKIRQMLLWIRTATSSIVGDIFGVFMNSLIQFQKIIIKIKDLASKLIGTGFVTMHMVQGAIWTGQSVWRGPIGGTLRALCFKQDTPLLLKNGKTVKIKDISLGDILENGSEVYGKLELKGDKTNPFYKIWSNKLDQFIYVTGEHKIFDDGYNDSNSPHFKQFLENYRKVSRFENAEKTDIYENKLSCLITSDHQIPVGEYTFWDWED